MRQCVILPGGHSRWGLHCIGVPSFSETSGPEIVSGAVEEVGLEEDYPAAGFVRHMPTTVGRGRMANGLHRSTRSNRAAKMLAASRLRFTAAAVRKACMRMFESPRLTARARP